MAATNLVIETHGLSKTYKEVSALKSLDLAVSHNSIFGFLVQFQTTFLDTDKCAS
jgi:hypothetical protein